MKVGDYVRTKDGCIAKFEGINESFYEFDNIIMDESTAVRDELFVDIVEKSSPNIIDLIEVGDYVNGYLVEEIYQPINKEIGKLIKFSTDNVSGWEYEAEEIGENDIKSILTKEQFESMEYKVKE